MMENQNEESEMVQNIHPSQEEDSMSYGPLQDTNYLDVGQSIEVYWPLDDKFYAGNVESYNNGSRKWSISYNEGDKETLNLAEETWRYNTITSHAEL